MAVDLHLHTHFSDGNWSPTDAIEHAVSMKLKHIAVTDHDTVSGIAEAKQAAQGRLEIIAGVEINTIWQAPDGRWQDIHVLGYFLDIENRDLLALLERQRHERELHTHRCIARLNELGVPITLEHVQGLSGKGAVGKPHLAKAIIAAGGAENATEAFDKYLVRGTQAYVEKENASPQEAIQAINAAGGIASIAHPGVEDYILDLILKLKQEGLRAIEAYHRMHGSERIEEYARFAQQNGMLLTGGSDCHGPYKEYKPTLGTVPVPFQLLSPLRAASRGLYQPAL